MRNGDEACSAVSRLLVHDGIATAATFADRLTEASLEREHHTRRHTQKVRPPVARH